MAAGVDDGVTGSALRVGTALLLAGSALAVVATGFAPPVGAVVAAPPDEHAATTATNMNEASRWADGVMTRSLRDAR